MTDVQSLFRDFPVNVALFDKSIKFPQAKQISRFDPGYIYISNLDADALIKYLLLHKRADDINLLLRIRSYC